MNCISMKKMIFIFITIIIFFQMILVAFASDSFEVKCTIENINKANITIEVYDLTDIDEKILQQSASQIFDYLKINNIKPNILGYFNSDGVFTINKLDEKLWLIKSGDFIKDNIEYKAIPQVIDSSKINSLEIIETKYEFEVPEDSSINYIVRKEWIDIENTKHDAISVSIFHDGIIYDTVSLSDENNWTYQWSGADDNYWYVKENEVPEGYTVSYSQDSNVFKITNIEDEAYYTYIEENRIPTAYRPQTGLDSVLENIGSRLIIIIVCVTISSISFIAGKKINKTRKEN